MQKVIWMCQAGNQVVAWDFLAKGFGREMKSVLHVEPGIKKVTPPDHERKEGKMG